MGETSTSSDCDVPRGQVVLRAEHTRGRGERVVSVSDVVKFLEVSVATDTNPAPPSTNPGSAHKLAFVEIRAISPELEPVAKRRFDVIDANGKRVRVTTDNSGRALLLDQPIGRMSINAGDDVLASATLVPGRNVVSVTIIPD